MKRTSGARSCFIGIDLGTSGCKAIAVDEAGAVVARSSGKYPLFTPRPGWAEQDPSDWWRAVDDAMAGLRATLPSSHAVKAIGLSGHMHGLVALDGADRVIRPAMLWCDQRGAAQSEEMTKKVGGLEHLVALIGNRLWPCDTAPKILWLREQEPAGYERLRRFLNPKDHLRLQMTGEHATDVSDASGTGLFDVKHRSWSSPLLEASGLSLDQVPTAYESQAVTGRLRPSVAEAWGLPRLPVVGGGGDSVVQTTAMGVVSEGPLGVTLGTAGVVAGATGTCPENLRGLLHVSCGNAPDRWHTMGVSLNGGGSFQWLLETLREVPGAVLDFDTLVRLARTAPAGSEGLTFLPYLMGERCPRVAPAARGALVGLARGHGLGHVVRSIMEGTILNLRAILDLFLESGRGCAEVRASGGSTASPFWLTLLADGLGQEVVTVTGACEGAAYGAALLAGVGVGAWNHLDEAVGVIRETGRARPDPGRSAEYERAMRTQRSLFEVLGPTMGAAS